MKMKKEINEIIEEELIKKSDCPCPCILNINEQLSKSFLGLIDLVAFFTHILLFLSLSVALLEFYQV